MHPLSGRRPSRPLCGAACLLAALAGLGRAAPPAGRVDLPAGTDAIRWLQADPERGADAGTAPQDPDAAGAVLRRAAGGGHVVVVLDGIPDDLGRRRLQDGGMRLLAPLGGEAWFAVVDGAAPRTVDPAIREVHPVQRSWKLHPLLAAGHVPPWSRVPPADGNATADMIVNVVLHGDIGLDAAPALARRHGGRVENIVDVVHGAVLRVPVSAVGDLAGEDAVQWVEPPLPAWGPLLDQVRILTGANVVQAPPYDLDGSGVIVLVYDVAQADALHPDFGGRLTIGPSDTNGPFFHSTHVSGIIGGSGLDSCGLFRGMAPAVNLLSYGFRSDARGTPMYTNPGDLADDYAEARALGADLANNSIGTNLCVNGMNDPDRWDCEFTGDYGVTSAVIDGIVADTTGGPLRVVWAAGNERACDRCTGAGGADIDGFHSVVPPSCAKNPLVVGAVESGNAAMTAFSSWGPCDDGRLKPEVVAPGCQSDGDGGVTSTVDGDGYLALCGTSMAAPAVAGEQALLLQDYRRRHRGKAEPNNALMKAIIVHTADDWGVEDGYRGPDYMSGFGMVRFEEAVRFLRDGWFVQDTATAGEVAAWHFEVGPENGPLRATLVWDDPPGVPNVEAALINDLDLRAVSPGGDIVYPWTLDGSTPSLAARRSGPDRINNVEQVEIDAPSTGTWRIEVAGHAVRSGPQSFGLCVTAGSLPLQDCDGNAVSDPADIAAGTHTDCNANAVPDVCDLTGAGGADCQPDGIPDECQDDCDGNGVPDDCDIAAGRLADCNGNSTPDGCELGADRPDLVVRLDPPLPLPADSLTVHAVDLQRPGRVSAAELTLDITHRNISDLRIRLQHGTASAIVFDACPADGGDLDGTVLRDDADQAVCTAAPPYAGVFRPSHPLAIFDGAVAAGSWQLLVTSLGTGGCGLLHGWSLRLGLPDLDCNRNGIPDDCDIADGTLTDADGDGLPDDCGPPCPVIDGSAPPAGAIDARMPHDPADAGLRFGWSTFDLTVPGGAAEQLTVDDFSITQEGGSAAPPDLAGVRAVDEHTVRVSLSGPIAPGAWTVLHPLCSPQSLRVGFLPGDVDGDGTTGAVDVLALIDALNDVAPRPLYAADINRSGLDDPLDILMLIDLLNGAGTFEPWNGRSLP